MTLIDASVIIDYLRSPDSQLLAAIRACDPVVCGVTRTEILSGSRGSAHQQRLTSILDSFGQISLSDAFWDVAGDHLSKLRTSGITVPFPDAVLSALAITLGIELWSRDQHFPLIQRVFPALQLFRESP